MACSLPFHGNAAVALAGLWAARAAALGLRHPYGRRLLPWPSRKTPLIGDRLGKMAYAVPAAPVRDRCPAARSPTEKRHASMATPAAAISL